MTVLTWSLIYKRVNPLFNWISIQTERKRLQLLKMVGDLLILEKGDSLPM